ncbi:probable serine hydrolase [Contarinia nasturtii]|uniref:probable serine hydrolase n=1 Tax=Contarinia nasturtii TaxID=265458 RepID=UPI0012D41C08|nr:probable serine hydrolase [Contarinia nasturtii]
MLILKKLRPIFKSNLMTGRLLSTTPIKLQSVESKIEKPKEVRIEVPWGHISGIWYGPENTQPILLVHGWQDCSTVFATLIPLLPPEFSYLAIDLPGHGFSSHYPKGIYYHGIDFVALLENIRQKYNWPQLSLLSHSLGAIVSSVYASIYPQNVRCACALDTLKILSVDPKLVEQIQNWQMKKLIALNDKQPPPEYSYDELPERVYVGSKKSIDFDKTKYLIERGTMRSSSDPNKFYFTRDIRVKFMHTLFVDQQTGLEYIKRIKAPYLFIRGDDRDFAESEDNINEGVEVFRKHNKQFEMMKVTGTHHFHLNQPEMIAERVGHFFKTYHGQ